MKENNPQLKEILARLRISELNPMQKASLEAHQGKEDIVLYSPTGSGKTLAFLLPLLENKSLFDGKIWVLIVAPSRELALQIESVFQSLSSGYKICCCYGGHSFAVERRSLESGADIVVGTPGRITDHLQKRTMDLSSVRHLILDEFDKTLEFGFENEMKTIFRSLVSLQKRVLTSATDALEIPEFTGLKNYRTLDYFSDSSASKLIVRKVLSPDRDKLDTLYHLLCQLQGAPTIVFCNYRESVERISSFLSDKGVPNTFYHGAMEQDQRELSLCRFRNGSAYLLISTDLAARGLDIPQIQYIIHYHLPSTYEVFVHRNGRTARMNADGVAYVLVGEGQDLPPFTEQIKQVERIVAQKSTPVLPEWSTLWLSKGKKDKISRADIVGFFCCQLGLAKEEIGKIELKDYHAYLALPSSKIERIAQDAGKLKMKNRSIKARVME